MNKWLKCSNKPDTGRNVFIIRGSDKLRSVTIGHYDKEMNLWYEDRNWFAKPMFDALYWCEIPPLPEHYWEEHGES